MQNPLALVIEDDVPHANLFSEALQKAGFEIETIRDGQVALTRLAEITPMLVVLDLHLPHGDHRAPVRVESIQLRGLSAQILRRNQRPQ